MSPFFFGQKLGNSIHAILREGENNVDNDESADIFNVYSSSVASE